MVAVVADFRTASATGTSITVDKPPGTSTGDTILIAVYCDFIGNWTAPTGTWDALTQSTNTTSEVRVYAREADGTEAATFTIGNDAGADLTAVSMRVTGADYASLVHLSSDDDLSNTIDFLNISAPAADSLDLLIGGWRTTVSATTPAGYSQDVYYQDRDSIAVWTDTVPSGATGSVSSSLSSSRWWAAAHIALGPSAGGGGGSTGFSGEIPTSNITTSTSALEVSSGFSGEIPTTEITTSTAALELVVGGSVSLEIPTSNITTSTPALQGSTGASFEIPTSNITTSTPALQGSTGFSGEIPTAAITLATTPLGISIGGSINLEIPTNNIATSTAALGIVTGINLEVPTTEISIGVNPLEVSTGQVVSAEVPTAEIGIGNYNLGLSTGVNLEVPTSEISIATFPLGLSAGQTVSLEVPTSEIGIGNYDLGLSTGINLEVPTSEIVITGGTPTFGRVAGPNAIVLYWLEQDQTMVWEDVTEIYVDWS